MSNDVLIAMPLFVFMGYLVERAELIEQAVQEPAPRAGARAGLAGGGDDRHLRDLRHRHRHRRRGGHADGPARVSGDAARPATTSRSRPGAITAGGCLGILIPPSVLLIVYGATAGVSVVQLYAGAFFPGLMLAALYIGYVIVLAKLQAGADAAAAARASARCRCRRWRSALARAAAAMRSPGCSRARGRRNAGVPTAHGAAASSFVTLLPALFVVGAARAHHVRRDRAGGRSTRRARRDPAVGGRRRGSAAEPPAGCRSRRSRSAEPAAGAAGRGSGGAAAAGAPSRRSRSSRRRAASAGGARRGARPRRRAAAGADRGSGSSSAICVALLGVVYFALDLGAARDLQDAADVVLPARAADPRGARLDRVRPRDADRGGGGRRVRRLPARRRLSLHRALARDAGAPKPRRRTSTVASSAASSRSRRSSPPRRPRWCAGCSSARRSSRRRSRCSAARSWSRSGCCRWT